MPGIKKWNQPAKRLPICNNLKASGSQSGSTEHQKDILTLKSVQKQAKSLHRKKKKIISVALAI